MVVPSLIARFALLGLFFFSAQAADTLDTLGHGFSNYDGTFDTNRLRSRVLDLGALKTVNGFQVREKVDPLFFDNTHREMHVAEGFNEFATTLKSSVSIGGGFGNFKANLEGHFNSERTGRTDYFYSRLANIVERAHLRIATSRITELQKLVIPGVAHNLATWSPQSIFATYGTHVTTGVVAGGMLELWSSSHKSQFSSKTDYSLSVDASYSKLVKGSASLSVEERRRAERVQTSEGLIIRGGTLQVGSAGEQNWVASTATNAQTIKFLGRGSVPIWTLIADGNQANRVRSYYEQVFGARSIILKRFESAPIEATPRVPHPQAHVYVPRGWKVVSGGADVRYYGVGQLLAKSYPLVSGSTPIGWMVESKDHLTSDPGQIQAFAIAIWDPSNVWDVRIATSTSGVAAHPIATATLPYGYILVGGGADVRYIEPGNMLVDSYPSSSSSWTGSSKDHFESAPSRIVTYAIGIKHRNGGQLFYRTKSQRFGPRQHPYGTIFSTRGWSFIGGGASVSRGGLGNMIVRLIPSRDGKQFYAYSKDHLEPDSRYLTVYGIEVEGATYVEKVESVLGLNPAAL